MDDVGFSDDYVLTIRKEDYDLGELASHDELSTIIFVLIQITK